LIGLLLLFLADWQVLFLVQLLLVGLQVLFPTDLVGLQVLLPSDLEVLLSLLSADLPVLQVILRDPLHLKVLVHFQLRFFNQNFLVFSIHDVLSFSAV